VEIAAVCDTNLEAAATIGASWITTGYRDLMARDDIPAVVNATPNYLHHEITLEAVARGKHILCEKPLSLDTARATEMLRAAEAAGVIHMTAFTYRYTPALQYMLHLVSSGELGAIRSVRAAIHQSAGPERIPSPEASSMRPPSTCSI
jgi:predicted dehydrogenase